jgi:hypothetical protein
VSSYIRNRLAIAVRLLHALALTVAFPCLVGVVVYYGFGTNYTDHVFHEEGLRSQNQSAVYKYRILGPYLLIKTHQFIESPGALAGLVRRVFARSPASLQVLDTQADALFYAAYFLQNTLFMVLACVLLYFMLWIRAPVRDPSGTIMLACLLMGLSQYVVCSYDTLSYALLLLSFLLIVRPFRFSFPLLVLATVVGALTRETAALTLSFFFAIHHTEILKLRGREVRRLAILVGAFAITYAGLRLYLGLDNRAVWHSGTLSTNMTNPFNLIGLAALPIVSYLLCAGSRNLKKCLLFLAASSPYIISVPLIATAWEIRLWVPVWLGLICLASSVPSDSRKILDGTSTE